MANTDQPYRRIGANSWEELLDQVNEVLQNPEPGCDPIDPIETPESPHKWSKDDIREVHEKLSEMPGNCVEFQEIPDKWKLSIIEDIEDQLENAWCDCDDACPNCKNEPEIFPVAEKAWVGQLRCFSLANDRECTYFVPPIEDATIILHDFSDTVTEAITTYVQTARDICEKQIEKHAKENELDEAENNLTAAESYKNSVCPGPECSSATEAVNQAQAVVDQLQEELDEIQAELDQKITERDDASLEADTAANAGWEYAATIQQIAFGTTFNWEAENFAPEWKSALGIDPWFARAEKECTTEIFNQSQCRSQWWLQADGNGTGTFFNLLSGSYTPNGIPTPPREPYVIISANYSVCYYSVPENLSHCDLFDPGPPDTFGPAFRVRIFRPPCPF